MEMMKHQVFLLVLMFMSLSVGCMDEYIINKDKQDVVIDTWKNAIIPGLTLQEVGRLAQTCKVYKNAFDPGKIRDKSLLVQMMKNYYRCTHALSRFAQCNNIMFKELWGCHGHTRNRNMRFLKNLSKEDMLDNVDKMAFYREYYSNPADVDTQIIEQLKEAIKGYQPSVVEVIVRSKKYNIFELFDERSIEQAFKILCENQVGTVAFNNLLALLPAKDGEQKNRAVQYIAKYDSLCVLSNLLDKGYLTVDAEYGYKCTLLHYAAVRGCRQLTYKLVKIGADIHAVNAWGKQPRDYAFRFEGVHQQMHRKFLYRRHGVLEYLNEYCEQQHFDQHKHTVFCYRSYHDWKLCTKEEIDWLRNSCTYDLENI